MCSETPSKLTRALLCTRLQGCFLSLPLTVAVHIALTALPMFIFISKLCTELPFAFLRWPLFCICPCQLQQRIICPFIPHIEIVKQPLSNLSLFLKYTMSLHTSRSKWVGVADYFRACIALQPCSTQLRAIPVFST